MKRVLLSAVLVTLMGSVMAQDVYDVARIASNDLSGTARFIGMGGAMGALGGDITTASTNPAGLGIFRSRDVSISGGTLMLANKDMDKKNRASVDQFGILFSSKYSDYSPLRYLNFGFNFRKRANFFDSYGVTNDWDGVFSQTYSMADMTYNEIDYTKMPTLAAMAAKSGVLVQDELGYKGVGANYTYFNTVQTGGVNEFDVSVGANINNRVFLGASIGYYDVRYARSSYYTEDGTDGAYYNLWNEYLTDGSGVDFKFGAIFRPIEESGFRLGVAVHTPIFYRLTDSNSAYIEAFDSDDHKIGYQSADVEPVDYRLNSPWKFNFSLGQTIGNYLALGAEYELATPQSMILRNANGSQSAYTDYVDDTVREFLKATHTVRLGIELKPVEEISIRAGYNFVTSLYEKGAYRSLMDFTDMGVDTFTDTQYENLFSQQRITGGIGCRIDRFYMDLAYQYAMQKSDFYAFDDYYTDATTGQKVFLPATELQKKRHQLTLTLGFKF